MPIDDLLQQVADKCHRAHAEDLESIARALDKAGVPQYDERGGWPQSITPEDRIGMLRASVVEECAGVCDEVYRKRVKAERETPYAKVAHEHRLISIGSDNCADAIRQWASQGEQAVEEQK